MTASKRSDHPGNLIHTSRLQLSRLFVWSWFEILSKFSEVAFTLENSRMTGSLLRCGSPLSAWDFNYWAFSLDSPCFAHHWMHFVCRFMNGFVLGKFFVLNCSPLVFFVWFWSDSISNFIGTVLIAWFILDAWNAYAHWYIWVFFRYEHFILLHLRRTPVTNFRHFPLSSAWFHHWSRHYKLQGYCYSKSFDFKYWGASDHYALSAVNHDVCEIFSSLIHQSCIYVSPIDYW